MNDLRWNDFVINTVVVTQAARENEDRRTKMNSAFWIFWQPWNGNSGIFQFWKNLLPNGYLSETSSLSMTRYRRDTDEDDYLSTLEDLDSRISDVLTSLAAVSGKINSLNDSYDSFETSLDHLEETAEGKFLLFNRFQKF